MIIQWDGKEYDYDPARIDVGQAIRVKTHTGCGMRSFEKGVDDADPICLQAFLYLMKAQAGENVPSIQGLRFSVYDLYSAIQAGFTAELVAQAAAAQKEVEELVEDPTGTVDAGS